MCGTVLCLATVALGVDVGWRPLPDGGMEYIIQIEPHMLEMLKGGEEIVSDIPPIVRGVRSYRITVGTDQLPREGELRAEPEVPPGVQPPAASEAQAPATSEAPPAGAETIPQGQTAMSGAASTDLPSSEVPRTLTPPADTRRLPDFGETAAAFVNQPLVDLSPPPTEEGTKDPGEAEPRKPWVPLTLALAGLFGSFGGLLYTGWIAWEYRRQYQALLGRVIEAGQGQLAADETNVDEDSVDDPG